MADNKYRRLTCRHCSEDFGSSQPKAIYCSRRCNTAAWLVAHPEFSPRKFSKIYSGHCQRCGGAFVSRRERAYCGDVCERAAWYAAHPKSIAPETRVCRACNTVFRAPPAKTRPTDFCSDVCKLTAAQNTKRTSKLRRAAAKRGVNSESVNPMRVFERDGWLCRLCGIPTPKELRGTYKPNAPELDHIVPLAKAGEHSYRNTQCLCRRCNGLKSDKLMA